jgi:hypothetical protein
VPYKFGDPTPVYQSNALARMMLTPTQGGDRGTLQAPKRTLGSWVHDKARNALAPTVGNTYADKLSDLLDFSPVGALTQGFDSGAEIRQGNYLSGGIGAALAALPIPGPEKKLLKAYHGSPNIFDKFSLDHLMSGEGNLGQGAGVYLASKPEVAGVYRDMLSPNGGGSLYEVGVRASPDEMLKWDAPIVDQPRAMAALRAMDLSHMQPGNRSRRMLEMALSGEGQPHLATGHNLHFAATGGNEDELLGALAARERLMPHFAGIDFANNGSSGVASGSRNYVVFDPSLIDIINRH